MSPKKLAALVLTGCMFNTVGCTMFGNNANNGCPPTGGGGCCKHGGGGLFGRMFNNNPAPAPVAVAPGIGYTGAPTTDCPCSYHGNGGGDTFHPAVMTQGVPAGVGADPNCAVQQIPMQTIQGPIQTMPGPVTTPGVPVGPPTFNPGPAPIPGNQPRIQPVPAAPGGMVPGMPPGAPMGAPMGVAPMGGAPAAGGFAAPGPWGPQ